MAAAIVALLAGSATRAFALAVKTWNGPETPVTANSTAPADDPGWGNFGNNRTGVYLGDQWVISADHAGIGNFFETDGGRFPVVPNMSIRLSNPSSFGGSGSLTAQSDIVMFRIGLDETTGMTPEELGARVITIADRLPTTDDVLTLIAQGKRRRVNLDQYTATPGDPIPDSNGQWHWDYDPENTTSPDGLRFVFDTETAEEHGFLVSSVNQKTWGTNVIADPQTVPGSVRRSGDRLLIEATGINDTVGYVTQFNRGLDDSGNPISDGSTPDEAQGTGDDSGGPVFFKDDGGTPADPADDEWVLSGVIHAIYLKEFGDDTQSTIRALFDTHTAISDLSHPTYKSQIDSLRGLDLYSVIGDVDLDGDVDGTIVNGVASGDLGILVENWLNEEAVADVRSWTKGDLNQDGLTDLADFALLREALGGTISVSEFSLLVAAQGIPEPAALFLVMAGVVGGCSPRRR